MHGTKSIPGLPGSVTNIALGYLGEFELFSDGCIRGLTILFMGTLKPSPCELRLTIAVLARESPWHSNLIWSLLQGFLLTSIALFGNN